MIALVALLLAAPPCPHPHRNHDMPAKFRRLHPCPGGKDKGSKTRCRGYVIDHWCPLACCGVDGVQNMRWMTKKAAEKKDRWELDCSTCRERRLQP